MSFIQARISQRFGAQLARLPAGERKKIGDVLSDIRMMNNSSAHNKLGNPRMYNKMGAWVRDIDFLNGGNAGGHRLVYTPVSKDANEVAQQLDGHVDVLGIGDPHNGSGFNQVNKLSDVNWW